MKFALFTILAFLIPGYALAQVTSSPVPQVYSCEVIIASDELVAGEGDWKFQVNAQGASHGGDGQTFTVKGHVIDASADSHWLTLTWTKNGTTIAAGLFVMAPTDVASARVAILYNPDGKGEQVSIGCNAN